MGTEIQTVKNQMTQGYLKVTIQAFISVTAFGLSTVWNLIVSLMPEQESE